MRGSTHHAQVLPVAVLANDVPQAVEGGTGVLVDGDLFIRGGWFVLACATRKQNKHFNSRTAAEELKIFAHDG